MAVLPWIGLQIDCLACAVEMLLQGQAQRRGLSQELQLHPRVVLANTRLP